MKREFEDEDGAKLFIESCGNPHYFDVRASEGGACMAPDKLPAVVAALYAAAGKPEPVILDRPESPCTGLIPGVTFTVRNGGVDIAVKPAGTDSGHLDSPLMIRRFAASLAILAGEAEQEPDPAEVEELARAIHGHRCTGACDEGPDSLDRTSAEAALRWMRDREAQP